MFQRAKILCTVGPTSETPEVLQGMLEAGMDAVRINTSHGDFDSYRRTINSVRRLANLPIILDTQGPKIRLRMVRELEVNAGDRLSVGFESTDEFRLDANVYEPLSVGDRALIDDGALEAKIEAKAAGRIQFRFINGGRLTSGRAVNFPKKRLPLEPLTAKDRQTLAFAREMDVDFIALSFTRGVEDLRACREPLEDSPVKVIAKIENQEGIDHFQSILENADGIMIARGDMGVELDPEEIPILQKRLIHDCNQAGKVVITATQMLQSMISNPRPTRAETSDVANAILDGSDVVMLSGETANGCYPVEAVRMMARIAAYTEKFVKIGYPVLPGLGMERAICDSIRSICEAAEVSKIVSITRRGNTAKLISRLRLQPEIIALTANERTFREMHLYYGVMPVMCDLVPGPITTAQAGMYLFRQGLLREEDWVLFVSGEFQPQSYTTNTIQVIRMGELADYCNQNGSLCE